MKELKQIRTGLLISVVCMVICAAISRFAGSEFFFGLMVIAGGAVIFLSLLNSCPSCGHWFVPQNWFAEYCPHCGKKLSPAPDEGGVDDEQK